MSKVENDKRSPYLRAAMAATRHSTSDEDARKLRDAADRMARNAFSETNEEMREFTEAINGA